MQGCGWLLDRAAYERECPSGVKPVHPVGEQQARLGKFGRERLLMKVGNCDASHSRGFCRRHAMARIFEDDAGFRVDQKPARCFEEDVRSWLPVAHFLGGHDRARLSGEEKSIEQTSEHDR